jgi:hypothetical protein
LIERRLERRFIFCTCEKDTVLDWRQFIRIALEKAMSKNAEETNRLIEAVDILSLALGRPALAPKEKEEIRELYQLSGADLIDRAGGDAAVGHLRARICDILNAIPTKRKDA